MPNWCDNRISITGPNALINKISMTVNAEEGILNVINPIPAELKDSVSGSESAKPEWQKKKKRKRHRHRAVIRLSRSNGLTSVHQDTGSICSL